MQFQVPQFIEVEDKIVGPLTIRQFIYIAVSVGLSFFLYFTTYIAFWFVASIFIIGVGLAFAFIKVNGQTLPKVIVSAFKFYWSPQVYIWQPENQILPKNKSALEKLASGISLDSIVAGLALKHARENVQTGGKSPVAAGKSPKKGRLILAEMAFPKMPFQKWLGRRRNYERASDKVKAKETRKIDYR